MNAKMKILKWLKRDSNGTTLAAQTTMHANGKKVNLERNESYLKALSQFTKWRQMRLATNNCNCPAMGRRQLGLQKKRSARTNSRNRCSSSNSEVNLRDFPAVYEEINLDLELENKCSTSSTSCVESAKLDVDDGDTRYCNSVIERLNALESTVDEYSNGLLNRSQIKTEEPEYALPYEFEAAGDSTRFMVTDLDKSEDSIETNDFGNEDSIKISFAAIKAQFFSGLLECSVESIKTRNDTTRCNTMNAQLQNGELDGIEVSLLQMKANKSEGLLSNLQILRKLRHPNMLLLMGVCANQQEKLEALICEPVQYTLYEQIHSMVNPIPVHICLKYILRLTSAVNYLHRFGIIHTNICSQNILLCEGVGQEFTPKLAGFELYTKMNERASVEREKCTQHFYLSPEMFDNTPNRLLPTYQTDIYGLCITLWEMLNCIIPYVQFSRHELSKVFTLKNAQLPVYEQQRHEPFKNVLARGLQIEMSKRYADALLLKQALHKVDIEAACDKEKNNKIKKRKKAVVDLEANDYFECEHISTPKRPYKYFVNEGQESTKADKLQDLTPNKKYSVNIIINSKCSPQCTASEPHFTTAQTMMSVDGFEYFQTVDNTSMPELVNNFVPIKNHEPNARLSLDPKKLLCCHSKTNNTNPLNNNKHAMPPIITEDFFIDDDFSNDLNLKTNLSLN